MISAVVFDVGGVLCPNPVDEFVAVDAEHGLPEGTTQSFFRGGPGFRDVELGRRAMADFLGECRAEIAARHGADVPLARLERMLERCMGETLRDDMVELVLEIRAAGHRIGLLTNIFAERRPWLHGLFPEGVVDVVCDSSEVGLRKPDREMYSKLLEMLDVPAEEVAFVDDFEENIGPAADMGIHAIHFESPEQTRRALADAGVRIEPAVEVSR